MLNELLQYKLQYKNYEQTSVSENPVTQRPPAVRKEILTITCNRSSLLGENMLKCDHK